MQYVSAKQNPYKVVRQIKEYVDKINHMYTVPTDSAQYKLKVETLADLLNDYSEEVMKETQQPATPDPLTVQVGGDHYKKLKIQPVEYIHANNIGYFEGNVIKYITRWRDKNGMADLEKAKHYIELLMKLEGPSKE